MINLNQKIIKSQARGLSPLLNTQDKTLKTDIFEEKRLWFITFVTHNSRISERMVSYGVETGEPLIFSAEDQLFIAEKIAEAIKRYSLSVITFNVLPDHIHLVILAKTEKGLGEYIRKIKGFTSFESFPLPLIENYVYKEEIKKARAARGLQ
jgi:hypothetical protein